MEAPAVLMQDGLGQNHALRRDKGALMDPVQRLLCERPAVPGMPARLPRGFSRDLPSLRRLLQTALDDLGQLGSARACHTPGDADGELRP